MPQNRRFLLHLLVTQEKKPLVLGGILLLVLLLFLGLSLLFIIATRSSLNPEWVRGAFKNSLAQLVSQELSATLEKNQLPADGRATTVLIASLLNQNGEEKPAIKVEVLEGELSVTPAESGELFQNFLLQAGQKPGVVKLKVQAGFLEKTLSLTLFDPNPPSVPRVDFPVAGSTLANSKPEIKGKASPGTRITLFTDAFENGVGESNEQGDFTITPNTPLKNGPHLLRVVAENQYGLKSLPSEPIKITIDAKALSLDLTNLRLSPNPVKGGEVVSVFVPASTEVSQVFLLLANERHELKNRYGSSIFSGRIIAPNAPGSYSINLMAQDQNDNTTNFNNAATLKVQ